jgi:hypothetical protein
MNRLRYLLVLEVLSVLAVSAQADEPKVGRATVAPNAAGIYWQAFSAMPNLQDEKKKTLDAATASTTAPLTDDLQPIVAQFRVALHELHRARAIAPCDWQLDTEAGPELLLPHLQKARELGRIALLRARQRFAAGEIDAAVTDVLAVLKMARDCGSSPILISILVDAAIEKSAIEVLAAHLPLLKKEQLDQLAVSLRELPSTSDVSSSIRMENSLFGDWLERKFNAEAAKLSAPRADGKLLAAIVEPLGLESDLNPKPDDLEGKRKAELLKSLTVAEVRESLQRLRSDYADLGKIAALPFDERAARINAFEESLSAARKAKTREDALRYLSASLLPAVKNVLVREEQHLVRRQLLEQAIRVQRDGADALLTIHGKKVEHHKTATGFELRCPCGTGQEVLTIGRP